MQDHSTAEPSHPDRLSHDMATFMVLTSPCVKDKNNHQDVLSSGFIALFQDFTRTYYMHSHREVTLAIVY